MQYVSIDIETTGLDDTRCQVLEFAAIVDDLENPKPLDKLPTFHRYLLHDTYFGDAYAIWLNRDYFEKRSKLGKGTSFDGWCVPQDLYVELNDFLRVGCKMDGKIVPAGKNFNGFDRKFLEWMPHHDLVKFHHRALDPAGHFTRPSDKEPPSLQECLNRAGIKREVKHTATEDAQDVILLLRHGMSV